MMDTCCFCCQSFISPYATRVLTLFGVTPFTHWILSAEMAVKTLLGGRESLSRPGNQVMLWVMDLNFNSELILRFLHEHFAERRFLFPLHLKLIL